MWHEQIIVSLTVGIVLAILRYEFESFISRSAKATQIQIQQGIYEELVKIREAIEPKG